MRLPCLPPSPYSNLPTSHACKSPILLDPRSGNPTESASHRVERESDACFAPLLRGNFGLAGAKGRGCANYPKRIGGGGKGGELSAAGWDGAGLVLGAGSESAES